MKKLFRFLKKQRPSENKATFAMKTKANQQGEIKTETKTYITMPMVFDYTAYYDDNEMEETSSDNSNENSLLDAQTKLICLNDEKCTKMLLSTDSQKFECCTN